MFLFHGSVRHGLTELRPGDDGFLHASPDIRLSSMFIARPGLSNFKVVATHKPSPHTGVCYGFIADDRNTFLQADKGGTIYLVDSAPFCPFPVGVATSFDWVTTERVTPLASFPCRSGTAMMIALGVRLYFIDSTSYHRLMDPSVPDLPLIRSLVARYPCENDTLSPTEIRHTQQLASWSVLSTAMR